MSTRRTPPPSAFSDASHGASRHSFPPAQDMQQLNISSSPERSSMLTRPLSTSFGEGLRPPSQSSAVRRESESTVGEATCSGYLLKRGRTRPMRRWRKRYFTLRHGVLRYFKTHESQDCLGFIAVQVAAVTMKDDDRTFTIDTGTVVYHLRAENEDSRRTWVQVLLRSKADVEVLLTKPGLVDSRKSFEVRGDRSPTFDSTQPAYNPLQANTAKVSQAVDALLHRVSTLLPPGGPDPCAKEAAGLRAALVELNEAATRVGNSPASGSEVEDLRLQVAKKETMERHYNDMFEDMISLLTRAEQVRISAGGAPTAQTKVLNQLAHMNHTRGGHSRRHGTPKRRQKASVASDDSESDEFYEAVGDSEDDEEDVIEDIDEKEDDDDFKEEEEEPSENKLSATSIERRNSARLLSQSISTSVGTALSQKLPTYGHPVERRKRLPNTKAKMKGPSLWSIVKGAIGKDLFRVSMPVSLFEPLCMLQRVCEDMTFSDILDNAYACETSLERLVYVAAFGVSSYSNTWGRMGKPFNPILGETFEFVDAKKGYRFVAEQVSHHPPISAMHAESDRWVMWENWNCKNKFWGKSIEVFHLGWEHVAFPKHGETYSFKKVTTAVHNIILGNMWIDHYGDMKITNDSTGEYAVVTFAPSGWSGEKFRITGSVFDARGNKRYNLSGKWNDKIVCKEFPENKRLLFERPPDIENKSDYFNFTEFACGLNELTPELEKVLPHTDTRRRTDQKAFEDANIELSQQEKHRLEEIQRAARRELEASGRQYQPNFFRRGKDQLGREGWFFNYEYWKMRDSGDYSRLPKLW